MIFSYLFLFILLHNNPKTPEVVTEFHELSDKSSELDFIHKYENSTDPAHLGYVYSIQMKQAEYSFNPIKKLNLFRKNMSKINLLIEQNKNNPHLNYVRLVIQEKVPKLLRNSYFIEMDRKILSERMKRLDSTDYLNLYIKKHTSL